MAEFPPALATGDDEVPPHDALSLVKPLAWQPRQVNMMSSRAGVLAAIHRISPSIDMSATALATISYSHGESTPCCLELRGQGRVRSSMHATDMRVR